MTRTLWARRHGQIKSVWLLFGVPLILCALAAVWYAIHLRGVYRIEKQVAAAIASFQLSPGMKAELYADESMVINPISLHTDDLNRLFVTESLRFRKDAPDRKDVVFLHDDDRASESLSDRLEMYEKWASRFEGGMSNFIQHSDRLKTLVDSNRDGRADEVIIFSDGYSQPLDGIASGVTSLEGEIYFGCVPSIWKLEDTDDDGKSDVRTSILDGVGIRLSEPGHVIHALQWGPEGKLYMGIGDRGYHIETLEGQILHNPGSGAVLRCNPDGSDLEEFATGFRNPKAMAFDELGNLFVCDNAEADGTGMLYYVVKGMNTGWNMTLALMPKEHVLGSWSLDQCGSTQTEGQTASIVPPVGHISSGPSGMVYYPGTGFSDRYLRHFFLTDFVFALQRSGIDSFALEMDGAGFKIVDRQRFMTNVLPSDVTFGLDGKMYVADWISWDNTQFGRGRIYTVFDPKQIKSKLVQDVSKLFQVGFSSLDIAELVPLLSHQDMRVRGRAHVELSKRGDVGRQALHDVFTTSQELFPRLHALWGLGMLGLEDPGAVKLVASSLSDEDPEIRAQAARLLGDLNSQGYASQMAELIQDPHPRVQFFALMGLASVSYEPAITQVLELLSKNQDRDVFLRHAAVQALYKMGRPDLLLEYASDADAPARKGIVLALRLAKDRRVARFLRDSDLAIATEAARAIYDVPIPEAYPALASLIEKSSSSKQLSHNYALMFRVINANQLLGERYHAQRLAAYAADEENSTRTRIEVLRALQHWELPPRRDSVLGTMRTTSRRECDYLVEVLEPLIDAYIEADVVSIQKEALKLIVNIKGLGATVNFLDWVSDTKRPASLRIEALKLLAARKDPQLKLAIDVTIQDQDARVRLASAAALTKIDRERGISILLRSFRDGLPAERQLAIQQLDSVSDRRITEAIAAEMDKVTDNTATPEIWLDVLNAARRRHKSNIIKPKLAAYDASISSEDPLAKYRVSLRGGDSEVGRDLVMGHATVQCVRCHKIHGVGGKAGPDLSRIASKKGREYLLESLINPSAKIATGFETTTVELSDGRVLGGLVLKEDKSELLLKLPDGKQVEIALEDIESRATPVSPMPPMDKHLSLTEIRDIIEFLMTCK